MTWNVCDCGECEGCRARRLTTALKERDEAREKSARRGVLLWQAEQERDAALALVASLRRDFLAALDPTAENVALVTRLLYEMDDTHEAEAIAVLDAIRAKAGLP